MCPEPNEPIGVDVVVLMAGVGSRLLPLTKDRPKALMCCDDGRSILEHTVTGLQGAFGSLRLLPVIGHGLQAVETELSQYRESMDVFEVLNPFYADAGPLVSLWLGLRHVVKGKVIVVNGDTLVRPALSQELTQWFERLDQEEQGALGLCASKSESYSADDMKIRLDENGEFSSVSKSAESVSELRKSAGLVCIPNYAVLRQVKEHVDRLIFREDARRPGFSWHGFLNEIDGAPRVELIDVPSESWREVDVHLDLETMRRLLKLP